MYVGSDFRQEVPSTPGQSEKKPMLLPLALGLLNSEGRDMHLTSVKDGAALHNLTNPDGSKVTTAVLHVDKVWPFPILCFSLLVS